MFDSIRRLMGSTPQETATQDEFQKLNTVAPLKASQKDATLEVRQGTSSFICREAVLDRKERISGYEFSLGRELQSRMLEKSALIRRAYDDSMLRNLAPLAITSLLGERFSFIRISVDSLKNPLLKTLSNANTVIMITPGIITESDLPEIHANLQQLGKKGIAHGWSIKRPQPVIAEFLHKANFIEIETTALDGMQLKKMCLDFRAANSKQHLIASELQTSDDFNLCFRSGFNYFMGPFISSRENWHPAKSEINQLKVFEALNMIRTGAELNAIADCLRNDPILTFKLLRYINSPGIGLQQKITEIQQALILLGKDKFYRWLSLLLYDFKQAGYRERVLQEQALTRARFMEILAGQGRIPATADQLFLTGLFSLLDVMIGQPLTEVLKQVALPEDVSAALKGEAGAMRDALLLGIAVEKSDEDEIAACATQCGLDAGEVTRLMIDALAWSQQVVAAGE